MHAPVINGIKAKNDGEEGDTDHKARDARKSFSSDELEYWTS